MLDSSASSRPRYPRIPGTSAARRALTEWRGVDLTRLERERHFHAKTSSDVLPRVLQELRIERRLFEAAIVKVWNDLIDPTITAHAQPTGLLKNGTLLVTVDSSVWLSEIVRYRRREILDRLRHSFGSDLIARISFRTG